MDSLTTSGAYPAKLDLDRIGGSQLVSVAREAFQTADVDFLCFGESDCASPASAMQALKQALDAGHTRYPDIRGLPLLRQGLSDYLTTLHWYPVSERRIAVTASGMAAINVAFSAVLSQGDTVVLITPAWPNPGNLATLRGVTVREVPLSLGRQGFELDLERLEQALSGARALVLNSPNNPTGWCADHEQLGAILAMCRRRGVWIISDEVYSRLVYDGSEAAPSMIDVASPDDRLIVCNSFSKAWAMTGYRAGWLVVPEGQRDKIGEVIELTHSGVAPFTQMGALAALQDRDFIARFRAYCAAGREIVTNALAGMPGVEYHSPPGAFYAFVRIAGLEDSLGFAMRLVRQYRVAIAPGRAFGAAGEGFIRICFAQAPERLTRAMARLQASLAAEALSPANAADLPQHHARSQTCPM
jgi:aspartate/methionine/tyrosine aminotransferase